MRFADIRRYLKPYSMVANRSTTINHAFAASIAPSDTYDEVRIRQALVLLGQNPDADLFCVYCGAKAETWDHVHATVKDKVFSGHGHRIGNLLPCCKPCNSQKGNKNWRTFLVGLSRAPDRIHRAQRIEAYLAAYSVRDAVAVHLPEYQELQGLRQQVLALLAKADKLAGMVRAKTSAIQPEVQFDDPGSSGSAG